jgi:hypothetical protein
MADEFFHNFVRQLEPIALAEAPVPLAAPETIPAPAPETLAMTEAPMALAGETAAPPLAQSHSITRRSWVVWGPIALLVVIILAFLFGVI